MTDQPRSSLSAAARGPSLPRRRLLALLSALAAWGLPAAPGPAATLGARIADLLGEPAAARALGRAYLAVGPGRAAGARALAAELPGSLRAEALRRALAARGREDFRRRAVVVVDGWVLAETEAKAFALTVLG